MMFHVRIRQFEKTKNIVFFDLPIQQLVLTTMTHTQGMFRVNFKSMWADKASTISNRAERNNKDTRLRKLTFVIW